MLEEKKETVLTSQLKPLSLPTGPKLSTLSKLHFEAKIDWSCVMALVTMVREKTLFENRTVAIDHALFLGGSINATLAKDKPEAEFSVANELYGEGALIEQVDELLKQHKEEKGVTISAVGPSKPNPHLIALLQKLAIAVLKELGV